MDLLKYDFENDLKLSFKNDRKNILINVKKSGKFELELDGGEYYIFVNQINEEEVEIKEEINLKNGAEVVFNYIGLSFSKIKQNTDFRVGNDSRLSLKTSYLAKNIDKTINLNCINVGKYSHVEMDNSCVVFGDCELVLNALGKILNGNNGSSHHQKSRCLTIGEIGKAKASPLLLIEENDVEASHALALGTIDEEQLYYLQSRGLSYEDSIKLLFESYLMPDLSYLKDQELIDYVSNLFVDKVALI